jgi:uncharacterized membrane protein
MCRTYIFYISDISIVDFSHRVEQLKDNSLHNYNIMMEKQRAELSESLKMNAIQASTKANCFLNQLWYFP